MKDESMWTDEEMNLIGKLEDDTKKCHEIDTKIKTLKVQSDILRASNLELMNKLKIKQFKNETVSIDISVRSKAVGVDETTLIGILGRPKVQSLKEVVPASLKRLVKERKLPKMVLDTIMYEQTKEFLKITEPSKKSYKNIIPKNIEKE